MISWRRVLIESKSCTKSYKRWETLIWSMLRMRRRVPWVIIVSNQLSFTNVVSWQASRGELACQVKSENFRPGWARDEISGGWMLVVNTNLFPQNVRTESCSSPNERCSFVAPYYESTCQQRYSLHRLIAFDPHDSSKSPVVALFKFPAGQSFIPSLYHAIVTMSSLT